ncbi:MAG TPA: MarR family transcriptional regulator [Actinomycetota bacterium]|nr:MarR family transcriptional regulator [Actinomycetota bacterium]
MQASPIDTATREPEPLGRLISMTGKAIREAFEDALNREGSSLATWVVLWRVAQGEWDSQRVLAKQLRIEGPTLTRQLHRMERAGLIQRNRHPIDRRRWRVELTPEGRELYGRLRSTAEAFGARTCAGLNERDQATLRRLLARVNENVGRHDGD